MVIPLTIQQPQGDGPQRYRAITRANITQRPEWELLSEQEREAILTVSTVLPFRTNEYLLRELIDWSRVPDDPIYQLTFPQRGMLSTRDYATMADLLRSGAPREIIDQAANRIRHSLNPHPAGQLTHNVPERHGRQLAGAQHKYRETVLFFPGHGQTCHAYCTFCFRWAQFVGIEELRFANNQIEQLVEYLREHHEVTNVLFTGGDPMIMNSRNLRRYIEPLLSPELEHIQAIRIGTKSLAYWPHRFVSDADADDVLRLFEQVVASGRHLALMAHTSHPVELSTDIAREAVRRVRATGANIRMQSPVIRHVNDKPQAWAELWETGVRLGCVPYYMFVERDTGARRYFEIPIARCWSIFRNAYSRVSGLARTVRGPSMSATPGKVHVLGVSETAGQKVFMLEYVQARDSSVVRRPFFAKYSATATWFDQLEPASDGDLEFFPDYRVSSAARLRVPEEAEATRLALRAPRGGHAG